MIGQKFVIFTLTVACDPRALVRFPSFSLVKLEVWAIKANNCTPILIDIPSCVEHIVVMLVVTLLSRWPPDRIVTGRTILFFEAQLLPMTLTFLTHVFGVVRFDARHKISGKLTGSFTVAGRATDHISR